MFSIYPTACLPTTMAYRRPCYFSWSTVVLARLPVVGLVSRTSKPMEQNESKNGKRRYNFKTGVSSLPSSSNTKHGHQSLNISEKRNL